jgi:hypothetical protein
MGCRRISTSPSNRRLAAEQGPWRHYQLCLLAMYHKRSPLSPRSLPDSLFGSPLAKVSQKTSMVYTGSSRLLPARTFALYLTRYPRISSDTTSKSSAVAIMLSSKPPYPHREGARMRCLNHIKTDASSCAITSWGSSTGPESRSLRHATSLACPSQFGAMATQSRTE